jgi:hypothetical protein
MSVQHRFPGARRGLWLTYLPQYLDEHGEIKTEIAQLPRRIEWWCPVYSDSGSIFGWEWTRRNRSKTAKTGKKTVRRRGPRKAG